MEENEINNELIKRALDDYMIKAVMKSQDINDENNNLEIKKEVNADFMDIFMNVID